MKQLMTITQSDIEPGYVVPSGLVWKERYAARAILIDGIGRVALLHAAKLNYYKLPGGGVEDGEDMQAALAREILEEVGARAEVIGEVGRIDEWRILPDFNLHQISETFLAKVSGQISEPNFTEEERAEGFSVVWADDVEDATNKVRIGLDHENPEARFMSLRDSTFLSEAAKLQ